MRVLLFLLLPFLSYASDPIGCAPPAKVQATSVSVKDGDWFDPATWGGRIPAETDSIHLRHNLTSNNRNIIIRGVLYSTYGGIKFLNINESKSKGSGMDVLDTDVGLWVMGTGRLNLQGAEKTAFTNIKGSAKKGTTQLRVYNTEGWMPGDEIFVVPTGTPPIEPGLREKDVFARQFERRKIKAIRGDLVEIDPLLYAHNQVDTFTAEVGNLTRSIKIEGTAKGRAHIFIHSRAPQYISNVELAFLGQTDVNGRYSLHFHHCEDGSRGSIVRNVAAHDNGFRVFVPHVSHEITFTNNIAYDQLGESFWWDLRDISHDIVYDGNLVANSRIRPSQKTATAFLFGQGDNNVAINNIVVYGGLHNGRQPQAPFGNRSKLDDLGSGYQWDADNESPWVFRNNLAHSNRKGLHWWQNTPHIHFNEAYKAYNNELGAFLGSYINSLVFVDSYFYNSPVEFKSTSGSSIGTALIRCTFGGDGSIPYTVVAQESPIPPGHSNKIIDSRFYGYSKAALLMYSPKLDNNTFKTYKYVDLIGNTYSGKTHEIHSSVRPQTRVQINPADQPSVWGTGTGLTARYYNDGKLTHTRVVPMVFFIEEVWSKDPKHSPTGPHHTITSERFTVELNGLFEPQYTGPHHFEVKGSSAVKLTLDGRLILDAAEPTKVDAVVRSSSINLIAGQRYSIDLRLHNSGGKRGASLYYYTAQSGLRNVPVTQLYPTQPPPPQPKPNLAPIVSAGGDIIDSSELIIVRGDVNDPENGPMDIVWRKISGGDIDAKQDRSEASELTIRNASPGIYEFELRATDTGKLSTRDTMRLVVPQPTPPVDPCTVFSEVEYLKAHKDVAAAVKKKEFASGWQHYERRGRNEGRVLSTKCKFESKEQIGSIKCATGRDTTITIPAGKHQAASQSLADVLALQDLNNQLAAACPTIIGEFELQGRKIIIYSDWTIILQ